MKLRIARKIIMSSDEDKKRYTENQLQRAYYRWEKSKYAKENNEFMASLAESGVFNQLMERWSLPPELLSTENATYSR